MKMYNLYPSPYRVLNSKGRMPNFCILLRGLLTQRVFPFPGLTGWFEFFRLDELLLDVKIYGVDRLGKLV